jgi:hypothetical protein
MPKVALGTFSESQVAFGTISESQDAFRQFQDFRRLSEQYLGSGFPAAFGTIFGITGSFRRKFYSHRWLPEEGFSKDYQNKQLFHRNQQKLYL